MPSNNFPRSSAIRSIPLKTTYGIGKSFLLDGRGAARGFPKKAKLLQVKRVFS